MFHGCPFASTPFPDMKSWTQHMKLEHGSSSYLRNATCMMCGTATSDDIASHLAHISRHLEEISAAALPRGFMNEDKSESDSAKAFSAIDSRSSNEAFVESENQDTDTGLAVGFTFYGYLFNRDKTPTEMLDALLRSIFIYLVGSLQPGVPQYCLTNLDYIYS